MYFSCNATSDILWMGKKKKTNYPRHAYFLYAFEIHKYYLVTWADKKAESKWNRIIP